MEAVNGREAAKFFTEKDCKIALLDIRDAGCEWLEAAEHDPGERQGLQHYFSDCI